MMNKQSYGYFNGKYFTIHNGQHVHIPENVDYKSSAVQTKIYDKSHCEIDAYMYHSDLVTECNQLRASFMKEFLINEKVKEILDLNEDYVVSMEYVLYNNDGKILSSGTSSVKSLYHDALITSDVSDSDTLEYRKAMMFDNRFEIRIPVVSSYGIKKPYVQHPYTLKINKFTVSSTVGDNKYVIDTDEQTTDCGRYHSSSCQYELHRSSSILFNEHPSHFITNAHTGRTLIDHMVVPAELQIPPEYTEVVMCEIPCEESEFIIKIDQKLDRIFVNTEIVLDNSCVVYDKSAIDSIIEENNKPVEDNTDEELESSDPNGETSDDVDKTDP